MGLHGLQLASYQDAVDPDTESPVGFCTTAAEELTPSFTDSEVGEILCRLSMDSILSCVRFNVRPRPPHYILLMDTNIILFLS